uniref:Putative ovule protein n=1 Tax=Solanum chacoense TaxID=4108 RepID=A0A0V0GXY6_SOLCH
MISHTHQHPITVLPHLPISIQNLSSTPISVQYMPCHTRQHPIYALPYSSASNICPAMPKHDFLITK